MDVFCVILILGVDWFGESYCFVAAKDEREFVFYCYCFWNFWWALRLHCEKPSYREEPSLSLFNVHFSQCSTLTLRKEYSFLRICVKVEFLKNVVLEGNII